MRTTLEVLTQAASRALNHSVDSASGHVDIEFRWEVILDRFKNEGMYVKDPPPPHPHKKRDPHFFGGSNTNKVAEVQQITAGFLMFSEQLPTNFVILR